MAKNGSQHKELARRFLRKSLMSLHMIIQYLTLIATKNRHPTQSATIDNETIIAARRKSLPLFAGLYCSQKSKMLGYSHHNTRGEEGTVQNLNTHNFDRLARQ